MKHFISLVLAGVMTAEFKRYVKDRFSTCATVNSLDELFECDTHIRAAFY